MKKLIVLLGLLFALPVYAAEGMVVLLPALKPACSSAMIFSACGFNLFSMIFSTTLLG